MWNWKKRTKAQGNKKGRGHSFYDIGINKIF